MNLAALQAELRRDEGLPGGTPALKPYRDTAGRLTVGWGRNLDDVGISSIEAEDMLLNDIAQAIGAIDTRLPWTRTLDDVRIRALVNVAFNLGIAGLLGFRKMLEALRLAVQTGLQVHYDTAAAELLNSKYAGQVGQRAVRLAAMLRTGEDGNWNAAEATNELIRPRRSE